MLDPHPPPPGPCGPRIRGAGWHLQAGGTARRDTPPRPQPPKLWEADNGDNPRTSGAQHGSKAKGNSNMHTHTIPRHACPAFVHLGAFRSSLRQTGSWATLRLCGSQMNPLLEVADTSLPSDHFWLLPNPQQSGVVPGSYCTLKIGNAAPVNGRTPPLQEQR